MTKEKLQAKLVEYQAEMAKLQANLNAFNGAIQATQYWLAELEKQNEETNTQNEPPKQLRPNPPQTGPSQKGASAGPNINPVNPGEDKNLYQEGNMTVSGPNPEHRPDSAISNMLPGGTTQSGETGGM